MVKLFELTNNYYDFREISSRKDGDNFENVYRFSSKYADYIVCIKSINNVADIFFYIEDQDDEVSAIKITNTGDSFKVFSTVFQILKQWLTTYHHTTTIVFTSDYREKSRLKLYDMFAKQVTNYLPDFVFKNKIRNGIQIEYMFERKHIINESGSFTYDFELKQVKKIGLTIQTTYIFRTNDNIYSVSLGHEPDVKTCTIVFSKTTDEIYDYDDESYASHAFHNTGTGDSLKIFSTVYNITKLWLSTHDNIDEIFFEGETNREDLYNIIAKNFTKFFPDYSFYKKNVSHGYAEYIFRKNKTEDVIKEVYSQENRHLVNYLKTDLSNDFSIHDTPVWAIRNWCEDNFHDVDDMNDKLGTEFEFNFNNDFEFQSDDLDEFYDALSPAQKKSLAIYCHKEMNAPAERDTRLFMNIKSEPLPASTWLIHFSDDAEAISKNGFIYGADMYEMGLTKLFHDSYRKIKQGYNFAFIANKIKTPKYGNHAVMFQASGVPVYHNGDSEEQIIFYGKHIKPNNIIYLHALYNTGWKDDSDWQVMSKNNKVLFTGKLDKVIQWVENNYSQYFRN